MMATQTRKTRRLVFVMLALLCVLLAAQAVAAQEIDPGDIPETLTDAAAWLGSAVVAAAAAFLLQRSQAYQDLPEGRWKDLLGASPFFVLPALSVLVLRMLGMMSQDQLEGAQMLWNWFRTSLLTWLAWQPARGAMQLHAAASAYWHAQAVWMIRQNELMERDLKRE